MIWYDSANMSRLVLKWCNLNAIWYDSANMSIIVLNWYEMIQLDCMTKYSKNLTNRRRTSWQTTKLFIGSRAKRSLRSKTEKTESFYFIKKSKTFRKKWNGHMPLNIKDFWPLDLTQMVQGMLRMSSEKNFLKDWHELMK